MPSMAGRVIAGRYRLIEPIGRGAMGVVWRASDQLLDRDVAVKEVQLNAALGDAERANAYRRTLREARTAARLSHQGVVTVFDVVEEDGRPWIIMELIRSQSLDGLLATDGPMPPKRAARIAEQLLSALAHAHAAGVLHRDVKPSNVLIATGGLDERAVLTDFGIAQFAGDPRLTQTGMVMGSPGFTAPERIRGGDATPASDLWSLGATMYAACEGRGPYEQRGGAITTMTAIINEDAPAAPSAGRLGGVIAALLRRDPARRPTASAAASMIADLLPALPDVRRGRVQRTATVLAPSAAARRSPARDGSRSGSPAVASREAGLVPPPAAAPAASATPAAPSAAPATPAPEARTPAPVTPVAPAIAAAAPGAPAPVEAKAVPRPAAAAPAPAPAAPAPAPASSPAATPVPRPPAASKAPPAPASPAHAPMVTPAADSAATTSEGSRSGADTGVKGDEVPAAGTGVRAPEVAGAPDPTAPEAPDLSPNGASATEVPASSAGAADAGTGEAATGALTAVAAGRDAPIQATDSGGMAEPAAAASGNGQGADAGADEPVTAPTVPVRILAAVTESSADAAVSAPARAAGSYSPPAPRTAGAPVPDMPGKTDKPEKDAWWATAYQPERSSSRQSPSQPGGSGPKSLATAVPSGPGTIQPPFPYQQQPPPSGTGTQRKRGKGRLTAILALAAVVIIAVVVAATMLTTHGGGQGPKSRTQTSPVSSTSAALPVPPLTKNDVGVVQGIDHPDAAVPSGWTTERLTPAQTGTAAGFSINVPPGWQVMPQQSSPMRFYIDAPDGVSNVEIDLTPAAKSGMLAQAEFVKQTSLAQRTFPGHKEIDLKPVNVRGTRGALWRFDWFNKNGTEIRVDDMFFVLPTKNGPQSYAIFMTAPEGNTWNQQILPLVEKMLQSFQPVTSGG